jgi:hypothetical protein
MRFGGGGGGINAGEAGDSRFMRVVEDVEGEWEDIVAGREEH